MKNLFNSIKVKRPSKSRFDLTHDVKLSGQMGNLIPIMATEAVPGDKFMLNCEALIRFAPLISPVMHRFDVSIHYFFVPNRILWPNWENFITNGGVYNVPGLFPPTIDVGDYNNQYTRLCDYLGIPPDTQGRFETVSALPFAAYQKIYDEYYRDQNLITSEWEPLSDGDNTSNQEWLMKLRRRAWEHDYFTSCLPWAQKGEAVTVPFVGTDVPVMLNKTGGGVTTLDGTPETADVFLDNDTDQPDNHLYAKTSELQANTTINELRRAYRLQEWLERNARAGTRYIESIMAHFGVKSSDKRLQRPEYITGIKQPIQISEVLNTAGGELPQGNMAGHGVAAIGGNSGSYFVEEHGFVMGIMSVMPKTAYQQGVPKMFLRNDAFDYYWPEFANIGEQPVQNREVYAYQDADGNNTFGYVPRYAEYKFENSRVAGDFRTSLDYWHEGRIFGTPPALNQGFIECQPSDRIFAVEDPDVDKIYCHVLNKVQAIRPMPKFGTPVF